MACTPPTTLSPGYLRLEYTHISQAVQHSTRARLTLGTDPLDPTQMFASADAWAAFLADCLPVQFRVGGYSVLRHDGSILYAASLPTPYTGTHTGASGSEDYASRTVTMTGRGRPATGAACSGEELTRFFVGNAFFFQPRQKIINRGFDSALDTLAGFLETNLYIWADNYGSKAGVRPAFPVQLNAHTQKRVGT